MGGFLELVSDTCKTAARGWLSGTRRGLGYRIPLELLVTEAGTAEVRDLLGRIEYEVLACRRVSAQFFAPSLDGDSLLPRPLTQVPAWIAASPATARTGRVDGLGQGFRLLAQIAPPVEAALGL